MTPMDELKEWLSIEEKIYRDEARSSLSTKREADTALQKLISIRNVMLKITELEQKHEDK